MHVAHHKTNVVQLNQLELSGAQGLQAFTQEAQKGTIKGILQTPSLSFHRLFNAGAIAELWLLWHSNK